MSSEDYPQGKQQKTLTPPAPNEEEQGTNEMPVRPSMRRKQQFITLILVIAIVAAIAQLAGVGGVRQKAVKKVPTHTLINLPGATVPDVISTELGKKRIKAKKGETVRMGTVVKVQASKLGRQRPAHVVCGIHYERKGDASWTMGTPYETVTLRRIHKTQKIQIERSFAAPATDTYNLSARCHVSTNERDTKVIATGTMGGKRGLPKGAARPGKAPKQAR